MTDVTAAIIVDNRHVLLARRADGQKHAGRWEFPGGKIEPGEAPEACLRRELYEELGIKTTIGALLTSHTFQYDDGAIRLLAYKTTIVSGQLSLSVHDQVKWVDPKDLLSYALLPADRPIAQELITSFSGGSLC